MRFLIVSNLYPPNARGGAEQVAWRTANELYRRGHQVSVLSTVPYQNFSSFFPRLTNRFLENIYTVTPPNVYYVRNDFKHYFATRLLWHLVDIFSPLPPRYLDWVVDLEKPDVIITHNLKGLGLQTVRAIRRKKIFHLHTLHDVQLSVPSGLLIKGKEKSG